MDEIMRNLAPPLGVGLLTLLFYVWARSVHRRERERSRPRSQPAEYDSSSSCGGRMGAQGWTVVGVQASLYSSEVSADSGNGMNRDPVDADYGSGIPLPLATAGLGMLATGVLPGGWSAGEGFLYGLALGFLLILAVSIHRAFWLGSAKRKSSDG